MQDFRGGVDAEGEPVAYAVGDDEGGVWHVIAAGPVLEAEGTGANVLREHDLAAVGMAGDDERNASRGGGVPTVRMVGEHQGEHGGIAEAGGIGDGFVAPEIGGPARAEDLEGCAWRVDSGDIIDEEIYAAAADRIVEMVGALDDIMISLNHVDAVAGAQAENHIECAGQIGKGDVNEIAGEENQVGLEAVGGFGDVIEHFLRREDTSVNVGDDGDGVAVEFARPAIDVQVVGLNAEFSEL